jgi:hypothetical protein
MIAVFDFLPTFCPNCGTKTVYNDPLTLQDFNAKCSFSCKCGFAYQKADTAHILEAAEKSGGDMKQHH